jgi:restriction system protein
MLPFLEHAADNAIHTVSEILQALANHFNLNEDERNELLPSGFPVFSQRIWWAKSELVKAGLLESTRRGSFRITPRGIEVLQQKPDKITYKSLHQHKRQQTPEHEARKRKNYRLSCDPSVQLKLAEHNADIQRSYLKIRKALAYRLLNEVKACKHRCFVALVMDLLTKMGYGGSLQNAGKVIDKSNDGGIDGLINENMPDHKRIYLQAIQCGSRTVEQPDVQAFMEKYISSRAEKGVFITMSSFSDDAHEYIKYVEKSILFISGYQFALLMIEHDIGVTTVATYAIKKVDTDYFEEE